MSTFSCNVDTANLEKPWTYFENPFDSTTVCNVRLRSTSSRREPSSAAEWLSQLERAELPKSRSTEECTYFWCVSIHEVFHQLKYHIRAFGVWSNFSEDNLFEPFFLPAVSHSCERPNARRLRFVPNSWLAVDLRPMNSNEVRDSPSESYFARWHRVSWSVSHRRETGWRRSGEGRRGGVK